MHTPGHAVINLATLGCIVGHEAAVVLGAVLPDVPIFLLYAIERLRGTSESTIWQVCYQQTGWLAVIHGAHSIPLIILGAALSWVLGVPALAVLFLSMLIHAVSDFPLHALDAHRHFFPFSQYRFQSSFSYWDLRFSARYVAFAEALLVLGCSFVVYKHWPWRYRGISRTLVLLLLINLGYAWNYWRNILHGHPSETAVASHQAPP